MLEKKRFHTLDALRFFAFLKVYLLHLPTQGDFPIFSYLKSGGGYGVMFFFVLSGFLITYILVHEKMIRGQLEIRKFFVRRSLRIWPLFFLIVIVVFLLPYGLKTDLGLHMIAHGYDLDWRYAFTFTENYKMLAMDTFPKTTPLSVFWSLCIEEHFYITWMVMVFVLPVKHIRKFLIGCIGFAIFARWMEPSITNNAQMHQIDLLTTVDLFAIGGLLGYTTAISYDKVANFILKIPIWLKVLITILVICVFIFHPIFVPRAPEHPLVLFAQTIVGVACTALIALFIPVDSKYKIRDSHPLSYLGRISYSLYVFHILVIHLMFQYCMDHEIVLDDWWTLGSFIALSFLLSVVVASLSYFYFEKPILKWRERRF